MGAPEKSNGAERRTQPPAKISKFPHRAAAKFYPLGRKALFALDAETAHHVTLAGLRAAARTGFAGILSPPEPTAPSLGTTVMGIRFPNPLGLAAGMDKDGICIDGFAAMGFGAVEIGTLTPRPQPGNPTPRLFRIPTNNAIINRMGFNNGGIEAGLENARARESDAVLGINIGKNFDTPNERAEDDYVTCLRAAYPVADYIAVNISSPNTKGLRDLLEVESCKRLIGRLKEEEASLEATHGQRKPIAVKISPDASDDHLSALAETFRSLGVDAVIATNTTLSRAGVEGSETSAERGGLSGAPLEQRATEVVSLLASTLGNDVPVIGVGGILSGEDAVAKLRAGAKLIQVYSGLVYKGPGLVHEILDAVAAGRNTSQGNDS